MRPIKIAAGILGAFFSLGLAAAALNDFQPVDTIAAGVSPRGIAVGNVYGNGSKSLIVANFGSSTFIGQTTPATLLNPQNSNLQVFSPSSSGLKLDTSIATASSPRGVFTCDLGRTGRQDILVTAYDADLLQVFTWERGQFVKTSEAPVMKMPVGVTAGLTENHGTPFAVVANYGSNTLSLFQINQGRLGKRYDVAVAEGPTQAAIGDLDGDGKNEIAVVCLPAHSIEILSSVSGKPEDLSSYAVSKTITLPEGSAPADLRISDLNGDGRMDLVAADFSKNEVLVYLQQKDGSLTVQPPLSTSGNHPNGLTVADLNGDGSNEIIVANRDSDSIDLFQTTGGQYQLVQTLKTSDETSQSFGPIEVGVLDVTGNGKMSLVASHMRSNTIKVLTPVHSAVLAAKVLTAPVGQIGQPFSDKTTFCYPNPTSDGNVKFSFTLENPSPVTLEIFDVRGEGVWRQNLSSSQTQGGVNLLSWEGTNQSGQRLASGLYLCVITVGDQRVTRKVAIIH